MKQAKKKPRFEVNESGYHRFAVIQLAEWVSGIVERPFYIDGSILFVPDITCYENGVLKCFYEVVYKHPLTGKKIGLIEYWCYRNAVDVSIYEVSADYILSQTKKPDHIETMECYILDPHQTWRGAQSYIYADKQLTMEAQNKEIKKYLMTGKKLTALDALYHFSCFRLSARIYDLRSEGIAIEAHTRQIMSAGKKKYIAEYYIKKDGTQKD